MFSPVDSVSCMSSLAGRRFIGCAVGPAPEVDPNEAAAANAALALSFTLVPILDGVCVDGLETIVAVVVALTESDANAATGVVVDVDADVDDPTSTDVEVVSLPLVTTGT